MSEDFLSRHREAPRAEFRDALRARLDGLPSDHPLKATAARPRLLSLLATAASVAMVASLFSFPSVRAAARGFLDSFRVRSFAAIPVDPERFSRLEDRGVDLKTLLGNSVEVLEEPGEPERVYSLEDAGGLAGIPISLPAGAPDEEELEIHVGGRGAALATLDVRRLEELLELLEVKGVELPYDLDGLQVSVETPRPVSIAYGQGESRVRLVQSRAPSIDLPEPVDLERLGVIGLQLTGMSVEEARMFARTIDWGSTLLVPVPIDAATFREVDVGDSKGLLVTFLDREGREKGRGRWRSLLLWTTNARAFALQGEGRGMQVLRWANSME